MRFCAGERGIVDDRRLRAAARHRRGGRPRCSRCCRRRPRTSGRRRRPCGSNTVLGGSNQSIVARGLGPEAFRVALPARDRPRGSGWCGRPSRFPLMGTCIFAGHDNMPKTQQAGPATSTRLLSRPPLFLIDVLSFLSLGGGGWFVRPLGGGVLVLGGGAPPLCALCTAAAGGRHPGSDHAGPGRAHDLGLSANLERLEPEDHDSEPGGRHRRSGRCSRRRCRPRISALRSG